jgi:hypothetical protein
MSEQRPYQGVGVPADARPWWTWRGIRAGLWLMWNTYCPRCFLLPGPWGIRLRPAEHKRLLAISCSLGSEGTAQNGIAMWGAGDYGDETISRLPLKPLSTTAAPSEERPHAG